MIERQGVVVTIQQGCARAVQDRSQRITAPKAQLKAIGAELSQRIVQNYVYRRMTEELAAQGFVTVEEQQGADASIKIRVKRFGGES